MMELSDLLLALRSYGPAVVAVVFFLWRDYRREGLMASRIETLETETRKIVLPMAEKCAAVIAHNSAVLQMVIKVLRPRHRAKANAKHPK